MQSASPCFFVLNPKNDTKMTRKRYCAELVQYLFFCYHFSVKTIQKGRYKHMGDSYDNEPFVHEETYN